MAEAPRAGGSKLRIRALLASLLTATAAVVFVLGIWVGRDLALRHPAVPDESLQVAAPIRPEPGDIPRPVDEKFFDGFRQDLYNELEAGDEPVEETQPAERAATPTVKMTASRETPRVAATVARTPTRAPTRVPTATRRVPATATPKHTATARPTRAAGRGMWVVQIGSTRNGAEAFNWSMNLRRKGFAPHTDESPHGATTWYRVRLGPFKTREEAVEAYQKLTGSTEFQDAYITTQ